MRILSVLVTIATPALLPAVSRAGCDKSRRIGGSFDYLVSDKARDLLGDSWNVGVEYDFTDLIPEDQSMGGHISMAVYCRRFDNPVAGTDFTTDYTSFGLSRRAGAGADPGRQGLYAGIGVAAALLTMRPSFDTLSPRQTLTKLEVGVFAGANLGPYLFIEAGYNNLNSVNSFNLGNAMFTFGVRL